MHVFIVGSKGIPAAYGGYETFVDKLTEYQKEKQIQYHVACAVDEQPADQEEFTYHGAHCFRIQWKKIGPARAIVYDLEAIRWSLRYVKKHQIKDFIIYVLACRIGPFINGLKRRIHAAGGRLYVNPDGHEWLRAKWSLPVRRYWKLSERLMVKKADLLICDSRNIETYIRKDYAGYHPNTTYISYGAETSLSVLEDNSGVFQNWLREKGLTAGEYYLVVGRFVPENNYETMIREFMKSHTQKAFALITNVGASFLRQLAERTGYERDPRIRFVGTVYDQELLKKIREQAYGYLHGHEVGGTNPSLLEAMGSTKLNLLLDVGFNREVGMDGAVYWGKGDGELASLIDRMDRITPEERRELGRKARERIRKNYSWDDITDRYEELFIQKAGGVR